MKQRCKFWREFLPFRKNHNKTIKPIHESVNKEKRIIKHTTMKNFKGKKVLITGASKGIGKACAIKFAEYGAEVIINYRSGKEDAEETLRLVKKAGGTGTIVYCDMGNKEDIAKLWDIACANNTPPEVLVLNAAFQKKATVFETEPELVETTLGVNVVGNYTLAKLFIDECIKQSISGNIVIHSSNQSVFVNPTGFAYSLSKAALNQMVKHLARATVKNKIRVNGVILGWFNTEGERTFYSAEQIEEQASQTIPIGRAGRPDEAADLTCFLASEESSYMTGSLVRLDGGFSLNPDLST